MSEQHDDGLALAIHRGEAEALACLVQRYADRLYTYAARLLGDHGEAQEVVQDAFLHAHGALTARYGEERCRALALRPWLYRITRNLALNRRRAHRRRAEEPLPAADAPHPAALRDERPTDGRLLLQAERDRLVAALTNLDAAGREAVILRFVEQLSYAEIGAIVGAGESVVRGRVFRALRRLRLILEEIDRC